MKTIYECPQSKGVKWSTIICFIVVFAGLIYEIYLFTETGHSVEAVVITSILLLVVFSSFLVFPLYIISDEEGLGIKTLLWTKRIPFQEIDHIETARRKFSVPISLLSIKMVPHIIHTSLTKRPTADPQADTIRFQMIRIGCIIII